MFMKLHSDINYRAKTEDLIYLAENKKLSVKRSTRIGYRLLASAILFRDSTNKNDRSLVLNSIRLGMSMLGQNSLHAIKPLLESKCPIRTAIVTVKMVGRVFEAQPPSRINEFEDLSESIQKIAERTLAQNIASNSENAALCQLAIYALLASGSSKALDSVKKAKALEITWFDRQMRLELCKLQKYWSDKTVPEAIIKMVESAITYFSESQS